jgi:capsular polysaccharide biosynthesis protein
MNEMSDKRKKMVHKENGSLREAMLSEWRMWLFGALLGTLAAIALFSIAPPNYRARATVVVDQNVEVAWTYFPDRQLFQFIRRETARLVNLAWSDHVLSALQTSELTYGELRDRVLQLSQPSDGAWHFYAQHADAQMAANLANAWAQAFVADIKNALDADSEMQAAREALATLVLSDPEANNPELLALMNQITELAERTRGVSPYVDVYFSQSASLPVERNPSMASHLFIGATSGLLIAWLATLIRAGKGSRKE